MHSLYLYAKSPLRIVRLILPAFFFSGFVFCFENQTVYAQELSLFEETESSRDNQGGRLAQVNRRDSDGNIITGPEFTLIGTTRIGENFLVVIRDRYDEIISINVPEGIDTSIPGHQGFEIIELGSGNVAVNYPEGLDCIEFRNQGVSCENNYTARLNLANGKPLESSSRATMSEDNISVASQVDEVPQNPFEALLERAASSSEAESDKTAFEPVRINPEDVPPGMRIVSTPFGDRLVEEE